MKNIKFILTVFSICVIGLFLVSLVNAQTVESVESNGASLESKIMPPVIEPSYNPRRDTVPYIGENHSYTVYLRGNGEAVVGVRVAFTNITTDLQGTYTLQIPKGRIEYPIVYQIIPNVICNRYRYEKYSPSEERYIQMNSPICEEYRQPYLSDLMYVSVGMKYQKAEVNIDGDMVTVTFPQKIMANEAGGFLLQYRGYGYVTKGVFGKLAYEFETLKTDQMIESLNVGLNVENEYKIKGADVNVQYDYPTPMDFSLMKNTGDVGEARAVPMIDSYMKRIGTGQVYKYTNNLAPYDTLEVKGSYAKSRLSLYSGEILAGIGLFVGFVTVLVLLVRLIVRQVKKHLISKDSHKTYSSATGFSILFGLLVSVGLTVYTFGLLFVGYISSAIYNDTARLLLVLFIAFLSLIIYTGALIIPSLVVGIKNGWKEGLVVFITQLISFILLMSLIFFVLFSLAFVNNRISRSIPMLEKVIH
jgi:hypothetical protein